MKSNWILNRDGSIYHLKLLSHQLATTIITVGDPDRVSIIANYLDQIETSVQSREFKCVTGFLSGKRISILSTGIGTAGIDIVMNEVDALFNLDLTNGQVLQQFTQLKFIRLGTSGAIQSDIPVDSHLISNWAISLDSMMNFYGNPNECFMLPEDLKSDIPGFSQYFINSADQELTEHFDGSRILHGCTLTAGGFYAAQGRDTRIKNTTLLKRLEKWDLGDKGKVSNIEMETAGIYGLANLMGHKAISLNAILANRITGEFSSNPEKTIRDLIEYTLTRLSALG